MTIGFSRNKNDMIFSVILQKYMKRNYSHCFIEFDTSSHLGDNAIYHSSLSSGIGYMSKAIFEDINVIVKYYTISMEDHVYDNIKRQLFSVCGKKYGLMQNVGIFLTNLLSAFLIKIKNPFTKGENCSEMVFRHCLSIIYPSLLDKYDPETVTPSDIQDIMENITKNQILKGI